jgi:hypothetical protein
MNKYQEYINKPTQFLALSGYTHQEFDAILPHFREYFYDWMDTYRLDGKLRGKRRYVDYKNSPLFTIEEKLFFILLYLKTNNLQSVQGMLFGISQPKANQWIHCLQSVLNQALNGMGELPARDMQDVEFDENDGKLYLHDGTERPIQRPVDAEKQKSYYSGKKTTYHQKQCTNRCNV